MSNQTSHTMKTKTQNSTQPSHEGISAKLLVMIIGGILWLLLANGLRAQTPTTSKLKAVVLNVDSKNMSADPVQMGKIVRTELEKLDTFAVMDDYDVTYLAEKNQLKVANCYGKICLVEAGKSLGADKMLTGSIEAIGDVIIYTLRFIDVKTETIERTQVTEFLNQQSEIQTMTQVMIKQLFDRQVDPNVLSQLIKPNAYDARARTPSTERLRLDGPRMGGTYFTGETAKILSSSREQGGYDAFPLMFQFGYQFEKQYLSAGNFQALFEFIPMVTGLDQGLFIPSFTIMNGLRENKNGWEFGFGPSFVLTTKTDGFYDNGNWVRKKDWLADPLNMNQPTPAFQSRLDSRGDVHLTSSFVFAVGKTFRSGNMNIPMNMYMVPGRDGWRFGLSFGYNARNRIKK
jgi:hypothetical protein